MRQNFKILAFLLFITASSLAHTATPVKAIPLPYSWKDNENAILMQSSSSGRKFFEYNIKNGSMVEVDISANPVTNPYLAIKKGDIFYIYPNGIEKRLTNTPQTENNATLSPNFEMVAFTRDNDLYVIDVESNKESRLTFDGSHLILNGRASWVYFEEIFGRAGQYRAFWWSPDSKRIAFYRFDDSEVPMFPIYNAAGKHGTLNETRYPKAGDQNPQVKLGFVDTQDGSTVWADFDTALDQYFGTPYWSSNGVDIMVQWMDRGQNNLILYNVNSFDGSKKSIYEEYQKSWVDWIEDIKFGKNGFYFVRDFELWEHIYYQSYDGKELRRLTNGMNWGVKINYLDESKATLIFTARRESSLRNGIYRVDFSGSKSAVSNISFGEYNYTMTTVSPDGAHVLALHSSLETPNRIVLLSDHRRGVVKRREYRVVADSRVGNFDSLELSLPKLIFVTTPEGYSLPGSIIYPYNFDESKKYPVIFNIYGGPNSTLVMDSWRTPTASQKLWCSEGVIQLSIDNRASGHFGKEGINYIHRNLGHYEMKDYIFWAQYISSLPYVDSEKIGITGFSYGGTMTVMALTQGAQYFKYGIAGAGVYDWLLYDTHYTERYMDHPKDNPEGYKNSAVINMVSKYRSEEGSLLYITHGTADDNVHLQNSLQLLDTLQKENKHFEFMLYPGALHGYRGYHGVHSNNETIRFWRKTLLDKE